MVSPEELRPNALVAAEYRDACRRAGLPLDTPVEGFVQHHRAQAAQEVMLASETTNEEERPFLKGERVWVTGSPGVQMPEVIVFLDEGDDHVHVIGEYDSRPRPFQASRLRRNRRGVRPAPYHERPLTRSLATPYTEMKGET